MYSHPRISRASLPAYRSGGSGTNPAPRDMQRVIPGHLETAMSRVRLEVLLVVRIQFPTLPPS